MSIIQRPEVFEKYHNAFSRTHETNQIVIHGTGGGASSHALIDGWILTPTFERAQAYRKGEGFPYNIDRNGDLIVFHDYKKWWSFHSGTWLPGKKLEEQHDSYTIGIELMNPANENMGGYTNEQYITLFDLIFEELLPENPEINSITGHGVLQKKFCGKEKSCPGPQFDWGRLISGLNENGYQFEADKECINKIMKI